MKRSVLNSIRVLVFHSLAWTFLFPSFAPPLVAQEKTDASTPPKAAAESKSQTPAFVRIERDKDGNPLYLQTTVSSYHIDSGDWKGVQIDLIGAVHIAHKEYYQDLNKRFRSYDAVLYELVADREVNIPQPQEDGNVRHPIGAIQVGMKDMLGLQFQLDEINYRARNFVHADMSPGEFSQDMNKRGDGFVAMFSRMMGAGIAAQSAQAGKGQDIAVLSAMLSKIAHSRCVALWPNNLKNMEVQLAGLSDKSGRSTLLTERNAKAFEVLKEQLKEGKKKIGIFYGAGHLIDMDKRLVEDFKARRGDVVWLNAWKLSEDK